ncbi:MAG: rod shape-determining protein MreC [Erythrobacter sp.]|jgi:rod shape-determining protein MreC|uniref:rod shape-determining protein MreC n=1 Tax=Qipengyuania citrea TaxID=225971 RepID=UPI001A3DB2A7|nr:rod shape-determining protein MreC [Qipengyuania citrea]MBL4717513.1 rod shape-determining protein MreC [Erythrobacter sp.]MCP2016560.1 rod shape-determining protein MreC [Qipengyuania citrea]MDE0900627.1 rod shape-determining protein MreC [Erythrobacter sp.]|tara:strand:- start:54780 stop:55670 length:891 start_codon:yes stop_codon:yes gene_type:complete
MAPTGSRRSGFSRRAQYNLFTGYLIAGAGALIGAILLTLSFFQPQLFGGLRGAAQTGVSPATETAATVRTGSKGFWETVSGYYRAGSKNADLKREMEIARIRLAEAEAVKQENRRLKGLLDLHDKEIEPVAVARLVGSSASSTRRFAYLGAGSNDGVAIGMPVRSPRGVVGRILEVGSDSARVLLLTDTESILPVRRAKDEVVAFAEGRGDGLLRIRLINLGINPLSPGDVFVTSGAGGYYPPGIAVAILTETTDDGGLARIVSDPAATDYVSVEPIYEPDAALGAATPIERELTD